MKKLKELIFILFAAQVVFVVQTLASNPCFKKDFGKTSFVCVCNSEYCDNLDPFEPLEQGSAYVVVSNDIEHRFFTQKVDFSFEEESNISRINYVLDPEVKYQTIFGWGGAFTDSAGINIAKLDLDAQTLLLRSYYDAKGLDYNVGRINMGGCDFSPRGYTYADTEGDTDLQFFSLQEEDLEFKIPFVKMAEAMRPEPIKLFASPWTAPKWMKSNNDYIGQGYLLPQYYQTWANYFVRFLDDYKSHGIEFWGLTAQNEPVNGNLPEFTFNCMGWNASTQREWIVENLGPSLEAAGYDDVKLMIFDDQRPLAPKWAREVFEDPRALKYVDGVAIHWYTDRWFPFPQALEILHEEFPEKFILYTEACTGDTPFDIEKVLLGSWERGQQYLDNILEDLNHWVVGWTDWNLALDMEGGPNWAGNNVDAPIIIDAEQGLFYKQPMYYALGHVSRFIPPGSERVSLTQMEKVQDLESVAFQRPDGGFALVFLNKNFDGVPITIVDEERGNLNIDIGPRSFTSVLFW